MLGRLSILILLVSLRAHAVDLSRECEDFLSGERYGTTSIFNPGGKSLRAELGSIEDRSPGTIRELIDLRMQVVEERKALQEDPDRPPEQLKYMVSGLMHTLQMIPVTHADPRLARLLHSFNKTMDKRIKAGTDKQGRLIQEHLASLLQHFSANLWELIVACLFDGQKIEINQKLSALYPAEMERIATLLHRDKTSLDREIDIVITAEDGAQRWIEVKDWDPRTFDNLFDRLVAQSAGQDLVRIHLTRPPQMVLVLKHALCAESNLRCRMFSFYDEVLFTFP